MPSDSPLERTSVSVHATRVLLSSPMCDALGVTIHRVAAADNSIASCDGRAKSATPLPHFAATCNRRDSASVSPCPSATTHIGTPLRSATSMAHTRASRSRTSTNSDAANHDGCWRARKTGYGNTRRPIHISRVAAPVRIASHATAANSVSGGVQYRGRALRLARVAPVLATSSAPPTCVLLACAPSTWHISCTAPNRIAMPRSGWPSTTRVGVSLPRPTSSI